MRVSRERGDITAWEANPEETPQRLAFAAPKGIPSWALTAVCKHGSQAVFQASTSFPSKSWLATPYLAAIAISNV